MISGTSKSPSPSPEPVKNASNGEAMDVDSEIGDLININLIVKIPTFYM